LLSAAFAVTSRASPLAQPAADLAFPDDPAVVESQLVTRGPAVQNYVFANDPSILWTNGPFVTDPAGGAGGFGLSTVQLNDVNTFTLFSCRTGQVNDMQMSVMLLFMSRHGTIEGVAVSLLSSLQFLHSRFL
jgi:hypothetical protein